MNWKKTTKSIIKSIVYFTLTLAVAFEAPYLHKNYLRNLGEKNTVQIMGENGTGTGFHVKTKEGKIYILTNKHVCEMQGPLKVHKYGSKNGVIRKIIKKSTQHDLCILEALPEMKDGIKLGSASENGESVYTLGHPRGVALTVADGEKIDNLDIQIGEALAADGKCDGEIVQDFIFSYCVKSQNAVQFSTPTYPGNSGSPVVNKWGRLVSVVFAGSPQVELQGFGVPFEYIEAFLSEIK